LKKLFSAIAVLALCTSAVYGATETSDTSAVSAETLVRTQNRIDCPNATELKAPSPKELESPITLNDALSIAFRYNPSLRIVTDQLEKARDVVNETRAAFNPTFSASAEIIRQNEITSSFAAAPGTDPVEFVLQKASAADGQVVATLPLDINKRLGFLKDISKYQFDIQYLSLLTTSEDLILNVKAAYYELIRACGQQDVAQAAVDVAQTRLKNTQAMFDAGTVAKFDVTTAQTNLENLNQQLIQAQSRVRSSQAALNRVLGVDINIPTQIVEETPTVHGVPVDVPAAVQTAYAKRPEVLAQETAVRLAEKGVKLQRSAYYPTLAAQVVTGYTFATTGLNTSNTSYQGSLQINIPIWNGGITRAKVEQAQQEVSIAKDTLSQVQLGVALDVRSAAISLEEAATRIASTQQTVDLAEESLRLANVRYNAGIAILVEVLNAESELTQAQYNNINAQSDYSTAQAKLQRATSCIPELASLSLLNPVETRP
jgi:outer membrane protein TolC